MERSVVLPAFELMGAAYNAAVQQLGCPCWPAVKCGCAALLCPFVHSVLGSGAAVQQLWSCWT
jgi:hypothetical protein